MVGGAYWMIRSATGLPVQIDLPKSPWTIDSMYVPYRTAIGLSIPNSWVSASLVWRLAEGLSASIRSMMLPGMSCTIATTRKTSRKMEGSIPSTRLTIYLSIGLFPSGRLPVSLAGLALVGAAVLLHGNHARVSVG